MLRYALLGMGFLGSVFAKCPEDMGDYRSDFVKQSFDPKGLIGLMYENAYKDIAQIGASCPKFDTSLDLDTGVFTVAFKVFYGPIPFTIQEIYTPNNDGFKGRYTKTANMPGGDLLQLDTVFVDVEVGLNGEYDSAIIFACTTPLGAVTVEEINIITRNRDLPAADLAQLQKTAINAGVPDAGNLTVVDWTECK